MCESLVNWRRCDIKLRVKAAYLAWGIWSDRNSIVFNDTTTPPSILMARVDRWVDEAGAYHRAGIPSNLGSSRIWLPPPDGVVKLNADASMAVDGWIGLGTVARDSRGKVLFAATRRVRAHRPVEVAEAKALEMTVRLGARYGIQQLIVESDCQSVIKRHSKHAIYLSDLDLVLHNILFVCSSFSSIVWSHVNRYGNSVAHNLAKLIPFEVEQIWENHAPLEVAPYVLMDSLFME
ncbi:uncharacterized protein LOC104907491 [Beta vulgaris subsp. vulgaris]|uniref:uncharacterized protein LOC104907491 n=1 Tax=Beta vulgaris subsp. vulgaris TaxID=3555 RepID=UPI0005400CF6|nr:uncharacterized protein LOC104907491 [Beta vulgaris subsp. vulgaris]